MHHNSPEDTFGSLFENLHRSEVLEDGKRITDAIPKKPPGEILAAYNEQQSKSNFDIKSFFEDNFIIGSPEESGFRSDTSKTVEEHIESLWDVLSRESFEPIEGSSALPLPFPYIVPGGRFNEIYYWDSYFTMLGLKASGRKVMIRNMVNNFAYMIRSYGFIPNGNRTYFLSRSQPPFFSLMLSLLAEIEGDAVLKEYFDVLESEYGFWMKGSEELSKNADSQLRAVRSNDVILNRYFDNSQKPRPEMYGADLELAESSDRDPSDLFLNLRSACESGWDFSSRWLDDDGRLDSIVCSRILPVDLNCLMWYLEDMLSRISQIKGDIKKTEFYKFRAERRAEKIQTLFWNDELKFFTDFYFKDGRKSGVKSLAAVFPLYFGLATQNQADHVALILEKEFLLDGGLLTTTIYSGQQWDAPNAWAPLQWMAIIGLRRYGHNHLADMVKKRWTDLNIKVYKSTGKLLEKYNVENTDLLSGGGEYPVQDGFGWTNGVLLALLKE